MNSTQAQQQLTQGWQLHQQKKYQDAEAIYRSVLQQHADNANGWCFLGIALHDQHRYQEAVDAYREALKLKPEFPIALNNLGNTLRYVQELEEADACFLKAIAQKPDYLNAYKNRGTLHVWTGNFELGLECYLQGLKLNPEEPELHRSLGVMYLLKGEFEKGWAEYRWRWKVGDLKRPFTNVKVWNGEGLAGRSIVLTAEQGLGDTLNFVRFAKVIRKIGANTHIYCQPALVKLLQQTPEIGPLYANNQPFKQPVHYQCSLLDVADILGVNADNIPSEPAYLTAAPNLIEHWRPRITESPAKLRIGVAWQGNPDHQADAYRSFPLDCFKPLAELDGVEFWSLQSGFGSDQLRGWTGASPVKQIEGLDQAHGAFMDSAAIMKSLDLFITSDTSLAHLAGALGVPCWIGLGYMPDWRWLLNRLDSPWYPSVRLFRQETMGNWSAVFVKMRRELENLLKNR